MASICNYSHPEAQITAGLERQGHGALFPYNPEFYNLASGLYGPGSIYCWYMILASVIINWIFHPKYDQGQCRPGVSTDFLAALAYPVFAATDALVQAIQFVGTEYRAIAIFCLRFPETDLAGFGYSFNGTQLDVRGIPDNIVSLGQHAIEITGPLVVCCTFSAVSLVLAALFLTELLPWQLSKRAERLFYMAYGYVLLVLTIFHVSLGDFGTSMMLSIYENFLPFGFVVLLATCVTLLAACVRWVLDLIMVFRQRDRGGFWELFKGSCVIVFVSLFLAVLIFSVYVDKIRFVPDLAVTADERDQLAALIGGIVTLGFTLFSVWRRWRSEPVLPQTAQEMVPCIQSSDEQ